MELYIGGDATSVFFSSSLSSFAPRSRVRISGVQDCEVLSVELRDQKSKQGRQIEKQKREIKTSRSSREKVDRFREV